MTPASSITSACLDTSWIGRTQHPWARRCPRTDWEQVSAFRFPIPSVEEQRGIADFLNRETARIDELIREKRQLVQLLTLRRGALLANTVMGRIGGFPEVVPTGDPALPELPRGWRPVRLRHLAAEVTVGVVVTPSAFYAEEGMPFIRGFNVREQLLTKTWHESVLKETRVIQSRSSGRATS